MKREQCKLNVHEEVAGIIRSLHPELKRKVKSSLQIILDQPEVGKALKDELVGLRSFRVGKFRIIYRMSSKRQIDLVALGPRVRIYEETYRLLKKEGRERGRK